MIPLFLHHLSNIVYTTLFYCFTHTISGLTLTWTVQISFRDDIASSSTFTLEDSAICLISEQSTMDVDIDHDDGSVLDVYLWTYCWRLLLLLIIRQSACHQENHGVSISSAARFMLPLILPRKKNGHDYQGQCDIPLCWMNWIESF